MLAYLEKDLETVLNSNIPAWNKLRNKTIFITGGTGFFGIWLQMSFIYINRKLGLDSKIIALTRNKNIFLTKYPWLIDYKEIELLEGDVLTFDFFEEEVDYIIHAATDASVKLNVEKPITMFETIVNGTKRVLEFGRVKKVKSFLFTSSGAVYGKQPTAIENLSEEFSGAPEPSDPSSVYGEGKRMAEVLCAIYNTQFGLPVKIARCYAFLGPFLPLDEHFAAGNFIRNLLNNEDIIIEGDGTPYRSYMYAADLAAWLWTILFDGKSNHPYNVGSDQPISIAKLGELISRFKPNTKVIVKTPASSQNPQRYVPSISRAINELSLMVYTDLKTSLSKTIEFNKKFN